ncbi:MAG: right-handed parallel beta-helix repeat-containing protein, partial [Candidatus Thorarchaeota archaeon]
GTRLDPGDLTDHVPIEIDGTADFGLQGWPGSGTPADPYIIAGLNITQDLGMYMISIQNTYASFIIRDCWINQGDTTHAIYIRNTTAAVVEYNTITSQKDGVYCYNSNDTILDHNVIFSGATVNGYAVNLFHSYDCQLTGNEFHSEFRGIYGYYSSNILFESNLWDNSDGWYSAYLEYCNGTTSVDDTIITGYSFYTRYSYDVSITGMYNNGSGGIQTEGGSNIIISSCILDSNDGPGLDIDSTDNIAITHCYITAPNDYGVSFAFSNNVTFHDNEIENIGTDGVGFSNSNNISVIGNTMDNVIERGYDFDDCDFVTFDGNTITNLFDDYGVFLTNCNNGTITNSYVGYVDGTGIELQASYNWTIMDNVIEYVDNVGISFDTGINTVIENNIVNVANEGINLYSSPNSTISNNQIFEIDNQGVYVQTCMRVMIIGNTIDDADSGIVGLTINNGTVESNTVTNTRELGISVQNMIYGVISYNTIGSAPLIGVFGDNLLDCVIIENTLTDCGFFFDNGAMPEYYHLVENNTVNGLPIYYNPDANGIDILASDYGQIFLVNNSWVDIHDNTFGLVTVPIEAAFSANVDIWNIVTSSNYYGMLFLFVDNVSIQDFTHHGSDYSGAIANLYGTNMSLLDSEIKYGRRADSIDGFYGFHTTDLFINGCLFEGNEYGIFLDSPVDTLISNNEILNTEQSGIYVMNTGTNYVRVMDNLILNATAGITAYNADNWTIHNNVIMYCSDHGIWINQAGADYINITLNTIENNEDGIWVSAGDYISIRNNSIRWNENYGVYLTGSTGSEVYYNIIALNRNHNGGDANFKYWDDGVDTGNWWDDASPPAVYNIYGTGSSQDRYPMLYAPTEPIISQPQDIYYAEGSEGNFIEWFAYDDSLRDWEVEIDGSLWSEDAWNYTSIKINVDGLPYGIHEVIVTLWDVDQNSVEDTVLIHVFDGTAPYISNTPNAWVFVGGSGQTLSWKVSDLHPDNYIVYVDEVEWDSGGWTSGNLVVNVDGMTEGEHTLITIIYDIDGNTAQDVVQILCIDDDVDPTIDSPDDFSYYRGETGNVITWIAEDEYPSHLVVSYNGTTYVESPWGGSRVLVNVDGLTIGTHTFAITVYDGSGNSASDSVTITVLRVIPEITPPPPLDVGLILLVAGIAGAAIVIVVVVLFLKKKQT